MITFIGHLHPLFVHLPIGIWIIYLMLELLKRNEKFNQIAFVNDLIFKIGFISAVLSIFTGLINADTSSYPESDLNWHKWSAFITTGLFLSYYFLKKILWHNIFIVLTSLILLSLSLGLTGHLGATLTHGEDYLSLSDQSEKETKTLNITNINDAYVYKDVVQFILDKNCVSCHGETKQKGGLRLDAFDKIIAGGKSGKIINLNQLEKSELIRRILLQESDDKHMPPKGKLQLNDFEIEILKWWVKNGADNKSIVKELNPDSTTLSNFHAFHTAFSASKSVNLVKRKPVSPVELKTLEELKMIGWTIIPLSSKENYYRVSGFNLKDSVNIALDKLSKIAQNIIELRLSYTDIDDQSSQKIKAFSSLEKLWLDHTIITNKSLTNFSALTSLNYLNLFGTAINEKDIMLEDLSKKLKVVSPIMHDTLWKQNDSSEIAQIKR